MRLAGGMAAYFRPWATVEANARMLRQYEPAISPGLLQTEGYMRALLAGGLQAIIGQS